MDARFLRTSRGFSILELLIVMTILIILAAMAVPNFFRAKLRANETSAMASLRNISSMQIHYETAFSQGYAPTLAALGPAAGMPTAAAAGLIDSTLAAGFKSGYEFLYTAADVNGDLRIESFVLRAHPLRPGNTGDRFFFVDQSNVIRWAKGGPASIDSPPVPE